MVARSQEMLEIFAFIERLARYPTTALITGESGTGKELVARALHELSRRCKDKPFIVCNCTTLAPTLLESELFGHVRGAFTGADRDRKGLFEAAHGGTIFLDEIGELPLGCRRSSCACSRTARSSASARRSRSASTSASSRRPTATSATMVDQRRRSAKTSTTG